MRTSKFALYAAETSKRTFVGDLLKYNKGVWTGGKTPVPPDELFVAIMNALTVGFVKWGGGQVTDSEMGLVVDGYRPPHRNDLDDNDSTTWEKEDDGALKDPWQKATMLPFVRVDPPNEVFTFSTATVGGEGAIAVLCEAHGPDYRRRRTISGRAVPKRQLPSQGQVVRQGLCPDLQDRGQRRRRFVRRHYRSRTRRRGLLAGQRLGLDTDRLKRFWRTPAAADQRSASARPRTRRSGRDRGRRYPVLRRKRRGPRRGGGGVRISNEFPARDASMDERKSSKCNSADATAPRFFQRRDGSWRSWLSMTTACPRSPN